MLATLSVAVAASLSLALGAKLLRAVRREPLPVRRRVCR